MRLGSLAFMGAPDVVVEKGKLVSDMDICLVLAAAAAAAASAATLAHDSETKLRLDDVEIDDDMDEVDEAAELLLINSWSSKSSSPLKAMSRSSSLLASVPAAIAVSPPAPSPQPPILAIADTVDVLSSPVPPPLSLS